MNDLTMNEQMTNATSSWRVFDDITYKKIETTTINDYSAQFRETNGTVIKPFVAIAPCGGPIAFVCKRPGSTANNIKYTIIIQNLPHPKRHDIREFDRGTLVFVDWTNKEDLLLVTDDGKYHIIDIFHYNTNNDLSITLSESASTITSANTFKSAQGGTGLVTLRKNQDGFLAVRNVYSPSITTIAIAPDARSAVSSWCILDYTDLVLAYAFDNNIATTSAISSTSERQTLHGITDVIIKMVTSSDLKSVALLKDNGDVFVGLARNIGQSYSFTMRYSSNNEKAKITDIAWCGSDSIIGIRSSSKTWYDLLIINGSSSVAMTEKSRETITNDTLCYTSPVYLATEIDGMRILSGRTLDFFQRLPNELFKVLNLLSESPGAKLYSAYMYYKYENQTAEMLLNQLKTSEPTSGLERAVQQCIEAASNEHDPTTQKLLLKSALFGRSFLYVNLKTPKTSTRPGITQINEKCTDVIRNLRLINHLQHINIGMPITYKEFDTTGTRVLIDRLLRRNLHEFATHVTKLLCMSPEEGENRILVQWAIQQIVNPSNPNEDAIADTIKARLQDVPGIPFIDIVKEAFKLDKYIVVERLLDVKISLSDQIDMLLLLQKKEEALQRSLSCGDNDLALYVLMKIKATESPADFILRLQRLKTLPLKLYLQCLEEVERNSLHSELIKKNSTEKERLAYSHIVQRFTTATTVSDQKVELQSAGRYFREAKNDVATQLIDDEIRLIARQEELEKKLFNVQLKGLSLLDTLEVLLLNYEKDAETFKKDFYINDKRFWWVKIQAYAKKNAWTHLLEFGKKPTSPIGYEPFIDVCIRANKPDEARRFADRAIYSSKIDDKRLPYMFAKVQMFDEAITSAINLNSFDALQFIKVRCPQNETYLTKIQRAEERLQDYDDNPLNKVFRIFNRTRTDE